MNENTKKIISLSNGALTSREIGNIVGLTPRYVRKVQCRYDTDRFPRGRFGEHNHQFVCGRRIDLSGYVVVTASQDHPYARRRTNRDTKLILEHRLVLEQKLGRYLLPEEVADHIDGLTLHNAPENLRVFEKNSDHLRATLVGKTPKWSLSGRANFVGRAGSLRLLGLRPVDIYNQRKKLGEIRLQQILLAALSLGIDSPYLLGTRRHTEKAQIDMSSRSTIQRALDELYEKWEQDRLL